MDYHRSEPLDYNDITENLRTPAWYDLEDDSSLLRDAATAITDLLGRWRKGNHEIKEREETR